MSDPTGSGGRPAVEGPLLASTQGNRVYIAGWRFAPELWLPDFAPEADPRPDYNAQAMMTAGPPFDPRGHVMGILRDAISAGVDVRALLWHQQSQNPDHRCLNPLAHCSCHFRTPACSWSRPGPLADRPHALPWR